MSSRAFLSALVAIAAFAHAACDTSQQRVLVWGTSTNGLGDVDSILAIRDFVSSMCGRPTAIILVTDDDQYRVVMSHLNSIEGGYEEISDVAQYVPDRVNLVRHFIPNWGWVGFSPEIMEKKQDVEKKIVRISAGFDRSVCYFNHACVFVRNEKMFVTPENEVDNSLTIDEYGDSTTTLWLKPQQRSAYGDYYFAYFHDDYCRTLARFIVTLRRLLQTPGERVKIITNVEYDLDYFVSSMKSVFGTSSWCSATGKHWTECNPGVEEMLRRNGVVIHEEGGVIAGVEVHGVLFELERIERVPAEEFDSLLFNSGEYVGCTGDSSLSKALSSRRVPLYQVLDHKKEFAQSLKRMWTETGGDKQNFDMMMLWPYGKLPFEGDANYDIDSFRPQFDRFIEKLFARTTQHVIEEYLRSGVACTPSSNR